MPKKDAEMVALADKATIAVMVPCSSEKCCGGRLFHELWEEHDKILNASQADMQEALSKAFWAAKKDLPTPPRTTECKVCDGTGELKVDTTLEQLSRILDNIYTDTSRRAQRKQKSA